MEKIDKLISSFLNKLNPNIRKNILCIISYGSRILNTFTNDSDLDLLIIINGHNNYRIGAIIDSINIDCTVYGIDNLYQSIVKKQSSHNNYFKSVLKNCYVYEDNMEIVETIKSFIEEQSSCILKKRNISLKECDAILSLYNAFLNNQDDYTYYNLLERIRTAKHYQDHCSYISLVKVLKAYENPDYYKNNYELDLPGNHFISTFILATHEDDFEKRKTYLEDLISSIKFQNRNSTIEDEFTYLSNDEIKSKLLVFYNRLDYLSRLVKRNSADLPFLYNITLKQLHEFSILINEEIDITPIIAILNKPLNPNEVLKELWKIFAKISANYRFDYHDYMLKLN